MDSRVRHKIVSTWAYNRSEIRKQQRIAGTREDDWAYAEHMLDDDIRINGEAYLIEAYSHDE